MKCSKYDISKFIIILILLKMIFCSYISNEYFNNIENYKNDKKIEKKLKKIWSQDYNTKITLNDIVTLDGKEDLYLTDNFNNKNLETYFGENLTDNQLKARIFSIKWGQLYNFYPISVNENISKNFSEWKIYTVLLVNKKNENKVIRVCFRNTIDVNMAIIRDYNNNCEDIIKTITYGKEEEKYERQLYKENKHNNKIIDMKKSKNKHQKRSILFKNSKRYENSRKYMTVEDIEKELKI